MTTNASDKNDAAVRDRTVFLGTDERGYDYYLKTERDTDRVVVVHGGERVLVDRLNGLRVEHVMATVADEIGWADPHYGHWGRDPLPCRHA